MNSALDAIDAIYEAGLDATLWPGALQKIADVFADVGSAMVFRRDDGSAGFCVSPSLVEAQNDYNLHWAASDLRTLRALSRFTLATDVITDRDLVTREEIETHPFYTQFCRQHGLGWCAAVMVLPHPRNTVWISIQRNFRKAEYSGEELELVGRLGRHVEAALRIGIRMLNAEAATTTLLQFLSKLDFGVILLDGAKEPIFVNEAAEHAMAAGFQISAALRRLRSRQAKTLPKTEVTVPKSELPIIVPRPSGRPFVVHVLPATDFASGTTMRSLPVGSRTLLIVLDLETHAEPDPALIRDLLGLTLAEARVAALVGTGTTPRETSGRLGVAEGTVRQTLKSVFVKTGVSRQTELALLLSRMALA